MPSNTHRANCANAENPGCVCTGCGGALHGWQGWTRLASGTQRERDDRRRRLEAKIETTTRGVLRQNACNRHVSIDLARLDVTEHLSNGTGRPLPDDQSPEGIRLSDPAATQSDLGRVSALGKTLLTETWNTVSATIDEQYGDESARDVRRALADHVWCGILVTLIRWLEEIGEDITLLSERGRKFFKEALNPHVRGFARPLAEKTVGLLVDGLWSTLARVLEAHFPLLGQDTLRALRMLALFTCPSVDDHPDVYTHAAKPLMGDARRLVSDEARSRIVLLFTSWWRRNSPETQA